METKRIIVGTLVGGVTMFLLGWLIYGVLLMSYMEQFCDNSNARPEDQMVWGAMIASNLIWALLISTLLSWSGMMSAMGGAKLGAVLGLLAGLGFDLSMYAMSTMIKSLTFVVVDCLAFSVMFALTGAVIGWVMSKINS